MKVNPTPAEKRKEYNKKTYLRRKEKLKKEMEEKQNTENIYHGFHIHIHISYFMKSKTKIYMLKIRL